MARLKGLPPRIGRAPRRVAALPKRADAFYLSKAWRDYRAAHAAWTRAQQGGVWCARCGSRRRLVLDHKVERKDGGEDLPAFEDAEWLCHAHHQEKTALARAERAARR